MLAHVPDLNDVVAGLAILLADDGRITMEFPHLLQLILHSEFDTIYHEHFSYFSLISVRAAFARHGLRIFDVEELPTHGGSIRIFACHDGDAGQPDTSRIEALLDKERAAGLDRLETYLGFSEQVLRTKRSLWRFVDEALAAGKSIVALRRAGEGQHVAQLLRRGRRHDRLHRRPQPVQAGLRPARARASRSYAPEHIAETRPDYVLILPWNLEDEIVSDMAHVRSWGGQFVIPIPEVRIVS